MKISGKSAVLINKDMDTKLSLGKLNHQVIIFKADKIYSFSSKKIKLIFYSYSMTPMLIAYIQH